MNPRDIPPGQKFLKNISSCLKKHTSFLRKITKEIHAQFFKKIYTRFLMKKLLNILKMHA